MLTTSEIFGSSSDFTPFDTNKDILDDISKYNPDVYQSFILNKTQYIGNGVDAVAYGYTNRPDRIIKFSNRKHVALANYHISKYGKLHRLAKVYGVYKISNTDYYMIEQERLFDESAFACSRKKTEEKDDTCELVSIVNEIVDTLRSVGAQGIDDDNDVVSDINLLWDRKGYITAMDYGFLKFKKHPKIKDIPVL